ncbi:MAG: hypothetical protein ABSH20_26540 [Tepidisphaeraceae bacterium]|jgi:Skp family chaperone for outer membrane proteins
MTLHHLLSIVVLILLATAGSAKAQTNMAVCDVDKVLIALDERRDGEVELQRERDHVKEELKRRVDRHQMSMRDVHNRDEVVIESSPEDARKERFQYEVFARLEE